MRLLSTVVGSGNLERTIQPGWTLERAKLFDGLEHYRGYSLKGGTRRTEGTRYKSHGGTRAAGPTPDRLLVDKRLGWGK